MSTNTTSCKNCEEEFQDGFEFCPHCGQKAKDDLTISVLFYNTISNYFSFDARFLKSFIPLLFRPGYVARKFVEGKRLQYLHPAQYYLFVSVIFFFLFSFQVREMNSGLDKVLQSGFEKEAFSTDSIKAKVSDSTSIAELQKALKQNQKLSGMTDEDIEAITKTTKSKDSTDTKRGKNGRLNFDYNVSELDSIIKTGASEKEQLAYFKVDDDTGFFETMFYKQVLKFHKQRGGGVAQAFFDSVPIAMFILLPIFALILKLFFWRRGRFAHHLVFAFYYFSFLFLVMSLVLGVNFFYDVPDWIDWLIVLSTFLYLWIAIKNFYRHGYFVSFLKTSIVTFVYMLIIVPIAFTVMIFMSILFY